MCIVGICVVALICGKVSCIHYCMSWIASTFKNWDIVKLRTNSNTLCWLNSNHFDMKIFTSYYLKLGELLLQINKNKTETSPLAKCLLCISCKLMFNLQEILWANLHFLLIGHGHIFGSHFCCIFFYSEVLVYNVISLCCFSHCKNHDFNHLLQPTLTL